MYKFRFMRTLLQIACLSSFYVSTAFASDCRGVKFNFENGLSSKIKIDQVTIKGNGKKWSHDINNKVVFAGESYTTDKLRLKNLSAGASGTFKVTYKWFNATSGRWGNNTTLEPKTVRCDNNMTIRFELK